MRSVLFFMLAGLLLSLASAPVQSVAQENRDRPHYRLDALSEADRPALQHDAPSGPQPFASARTIDQRLTDLVAWRDAGTGSRVGQGLVTSPGAETLNLGFRPLDLPEGAQLTVSRPDGTQQRGPYTAEEAGSVLYTPVISGETALITVTVPVGVAAEEMSTRLVHVGHGWAPPDTPFNPLQPHASGSCNVDTACPEADDWRDEVASVARITYVRGGLQFSCSGSLLNTTEGPIAPYVLTAQHCVDAQEQADTAVFYWNYEHATCRPPGSSDSGTTSDADPFEETSTGAVLRATVGSGRISGGPDITLLEVAEPLSPAYDLFYSGWTRADAAPSASATIHHPGGFAKRISFDFDAAAITEYAENTTGNGTHLRISDWDVGTTEPGSSGAPLYDQAQRVAGVLSGGIAACGVNEPDWYGRLAVAWEGSAPDTRLRDWLDPAGTGAEALDGAAQGGHLNEPPPVEVLTVTDTGARHASLRWSAPAYSTSNPVQRYRLRVDTAPIATQADFESARPLPAPLPQAPGTEQAAEADALWPETPYYIAIQSENAAGRSSITAVDEPVELPDLIPPAAIGDFRIAEVSESGVELSWTATGDDETRGRASTYDLRYAEQPIDTDADFAQATRVRNVPVPDSAGTSERILLNGDDLPRDTPLYFGLVAIDNAENRSPVARTERNATLIDAPQQVVGPMPNPARTQSDLQVTVSEAQTLRIRLYDMLGRAVDTVVEVEVPAFEAQRISLPVSRLASGTYFVRIQGVDFTATKRLAVVR